MSTMGGCCSSDSQQGPEKTSPKEGTNGRPQERAVEGLKLSSIAITKSLASWRPKPMVGPTPDPASYPPLRASIAAADISLEGIPTSELVTTVQFGVRPLYMPGLEAAVSSAMANIQPPGAVSLIPPSIDTRKSTDSVRSNKSAVAAPPWRCPVHDIEIGFTDPYGDMGVWETHLPDHTDVRCLFCSKCLGTPIFEVAAPLWQQPDVFLNPPIAMDYEDRAGFGPGTAARAWAEEWLLFMKQNYGSPGMAANKEDWLTIMSGALSSSKHIHDAAKISGKRVTNIVPMSTPGQSGVTLKIDLAKATTTPAESVPSTTDVPKIPALTNEWKTTKIAVGDLAMCLPGPNDIFPHPYRITSSLREEDDRRVKRSREKGLLPEDAHELAATITQACLLMHEEELAAGAVVQAGADQTSQMLAGAAGTGDGKPAAPTSKRQRKREARAAAKGAPLDHDGCPCDCTCGRQWGALPPSAANALTKAATKPPTSRQEKRAVKKMIQKAMDKDEKARGKWAQEQKNVGAADAAGRLTSGPSATPAPAGGPSRITAHLDRVRQAMAFDVNEQNSLGPNITHRLKLFMDLLPALREDHWRYRYGPGLFQSHAAQDTMAYVVEYVTGKYWSPQAMMGPMCDWDPSFARQTDRIAQLFEQCLDADWTVEDPDYRMLSARLDGDSGGMDEMTAEDIEDLVALRERTFSREYVLLHLGLKVMACGGEMPDDMRKAMFMLARRLPYVEQQLQVLKACQEYESGRPWMFESRKQSDVMYWECDWLHVRSLALKTGSEPPEERDLTKNMGVRFATTYFMFPGFGFQADTHPTLCPVLSPTSGLTCLHCHAMDPAYICNVCRLAKYCGRDCADADRAVHYRSCLNSDAWARMAHIKKPWQFPFPETDAEFMVRTGAMSSYARFALPTPRDGDVFVSKLMTEEAAGQSEAKSTDGATADETSPSASPSIASCHQPGVSAARLALTTQVRMGVRGPPQDKDVLRTWQSLGAVGWRWAAPVEEADLIERRHATVLSSAAYTVLGLDADFAATSDDLSSFVTTVAEGMWKAAARRDGGVAEEGKATEARRARRLAKGEAETGAWKYMQDEHGGHAHAHAHTHDACCADEDDGQQQSRNKSRGNRVEKKTTSTAAKKKSSALANQHHHHQQQHDDDDGKCTCGGEDARSMVLGALRYAVAELGPPPDKNEPRAPEPLTDEELLNLDLRHIVYRPRLDPRAELDLDFVASLGADLGVDVGTAGN